MRTFSIRVLGCKANQYEGEQMATLLRRRGLVEASDPNQADLRIIHTCSVTAEAARKSAQAVRRVARLPVIQPDSRSVPDQPDPMARTVVTGCWATSDAPRASQIAGVDEVIGHHKDLASELSALLDRWNVAAAPHSSRIGLPLLDARQSTHQRAFLKIQDGCDAFCTYCIIPQLRPRPSSKPIDDCVSEAQAMVDAGHREIVLTGIFLGAYGHPTALRRRQNRDESGGLARLVEAVCTRVRDLARLRLSSLEPGDLTAELIRVLRSHRQVVPHFHLPLQSGSDEILRRMNRQYRCGDYLRMIDHVHAAFDRPAVTTDIIVGFPGESDQEFAQTLDVVDRVRFIHTHAFSFSPRPQTAAARWKDDFVSPQAANQRIGILNDRSMQHSLDFRKHFIGQTAQVLVERQNGASTVRHGRTERYFDVCFESETAQTGDAVCVRIDSATPLRTFGSVIAETPAAR